MSKNFNILSNLNSLPIVGEHEEETFQERKKRNRDDRTME